MMIGYVTFLLYNVPDTKKYLVLLMFVYDYVHATTKIIHEIIEVAKYGIMVQK